MFIEFSDSQTLMVEVLGSVVVSMLDWQLKGQIFKSPCVIIIITKHYCYRFVVKTGPLGLLEIPDITSEIYVPPSQLSCNE